jgi:DNA-binding transcriptional ArsR family regulator
MSQTLRDYYPAGCLVLAAAVIGTQQAKEAAMGLLPTALKLQGRRLLPPEVALSNHRRFSKEVARNAESLNPTLSWAKAQARAGRKFGVSVKDEPAAAHFAPESICHRERIEATLAQGEMLTKDLARTLDVRRDVLSLSLNKLRRLGIVACRRIDRAKGSGKGQKPAAWRLVQEVAA